MRIVLFGLPDFAISPLKKIIKIRKKSIKLVVPGRSSGVVHGRFQFLYKILPFLYMGRNEVKRVALKNKLKLAQPLKISSFDFLKRIKKIKPDLILVFTYDEKFSKELLEIPKYGVINFHPSLLPQYRGPNPVFWSILRGDKLTGITAHYMTEKLDSGPVILQKEYLIGRDKTGPEIFKGLSDLAAEAALEIIEKIEKNIDLPKIKQDENRAAYFPHYKRSDLKIDLSKSAIDIYNLVRAASGWDGAYLICKGKDLILGKIERGEVSPYPVRLEGELISVDEGIKFYNKYGELIIIKSLGWSKDKIMDYKKFINLYGIKAGDILT